MTPDSIQPKVSCQPFSESYPRKKVDQTGPLVLLILDGWGIGPDYPGNAIINAPTPNMNRLWMSYPHTQLTASGEAVGLPAGVPGNSETGHVNMGAGSIVFQDLPRINASIADGSFMKNPAFINAINHAKQNNSTLHLLGLIGSGYVHSSIDHLFGLLNTCKQHQLDKVLIHGFTDGRDSPPTAGINQVKRIMDKCQELGVGQLATLCGRFFALDRDKQWDRIEQAYDSLTIGTGTCTQDPIGAMEAQYASGVTDEHLAPIIVCGQDNQPKTINDNDAVIFYNFRVDRPRELCRAFVLPDFEKGVKDEDYDPFWEKYHKTSLQTHELSLTFQRKKIVHNLYFTTMTTYEAQLPVDVAFPKQKIKENIGQILSLHGVRQLRITETEKERMVTYYMNGQQKDAHPGEDWIIYPSTGSESYDQTPAMRAREIAQGMENELNLDHYDAIIANICNGDMIGHTGNLSAGLEACRIVDEVVAKIVVQVLAKNGTVLITADHGNVEEMINLATGEIDTEHSSFPVPFIVINKQYQGQPRMLPTGILADIVPTILHLMKLPKPDGISGRNLFLLRDI
ncbi:2,3-bisphosphoglycerate-independent phosphoglycerate mutase [Patescibacteria group bacterium]|nr:2,3-bisphosphoglycerate-independent phosphoglycerate mutase [Patescibacteria group bacterium]